MNETEPSVGVGDPQHKADEVTTRLKVTHLSSSLTEPLGGAEAYCVNLAIAQAELCDVTVASSSIDPTTRATLEAHGVRVLTLRVRRPYPPDGHGDSVGQRLLFHALDMWNTIVPPRDARSRYIRGADVVHVHRFQGLGSAVLRPGPSQVVVHTVHDYSLVDTHGNAVRGRKILTRMPWHQRVRSYAISRSAKRADALLFPSANTLQRHRELGLNPALVARSRVLPLGWALPTVKPERDAQPPKRRSNDSQVPYFLFMGKLEDHKGVPELVAAWGEGLAGHRLIVAGRGPNAVLVRGLIDSGLEYIDWIDGATKSELMRGAIATIVPSVWPENFPLVVAESLLAGTPVIGNPLSVGPLVTHDENGLVARDSTSTALREVILSIAQDSELRRRLSKGASRSAAQLSLDRHVHELVELYRRLREENA